MLEYVELPTKEQKGLQYSLQNDQAEPVRSHISKYNPSFVYAS